MYLYWSRKRLSKHDNEVRNYKENNGNCIKKYLFLWQNYYKQKKKVNDRQGMLFAIYMTKSFLTDI